MPHSRVLLDTNIVIGLFAGDPRITDALAKKTAVFLAVPAIGELYRGAFGSGRPRENLLRVDGLINVVLTLPCDGVTARFYGELKQELRAKGRPIPENDLWIAAIAKQHSLAVMTRDKHFKQLRGIQLDFVS